MNIKPEPKAETDLQPIFRLDGMVYYPHYVDPVWVRPGAFVKVYNQQRKINEFKEDKTLRLSASELFARKALLDTEMLWPRLWTKGWQHWLKG
jgi:hypothetical protein